MKWTWFTLFILPLFLVHGQKIEQKTIDNKSINSIIINGDAIFKIKVKTTSNSAILLRTKIDGEDAENNRIVTDIKNDSLIISNAYRSFFKHPNDKLSAHKVLSIEMDLEIPEHLSLYFKSDIASAEISGNYKTLTLELKQGNAKLDHFIGNATINTFNGTVNLETDFANVTTLTKTGKVTTEEIIKSKNEIFIHTINGDINVFKTKN